MRIDCHNHSNYSMDGSVSVADMCRAAADRGIDVFAVTDHCDVNEWENQKLETSIPASLSAVEAQKGKWDVRLLSGVELGEPLEDMGKTRQILADPRLDLVIGSIHNVPGQPDFYFLDYAKFTDAEIHSLFQAYYQTLGEMAAWAGFDTLAHITYPYRYLNQARQKREFTLDPFAFDKLADETLRLLVEKGRAFELNGSSLSQSEQDRELNRHYLKRYRQLGGEMVTFGSDAHIPEKIGQQMGLAYAMLRECGFSSVTYFEKRQPVTAALE